MRIEDVLYFSPRFRFDEINLDDRSRLITAFEDRVEGFFLCPADELRQNGHAFACGVLCCAVIDFLARYTIGAGSTGERFRSWLRSNIAEFNRGSGDNDVVESIWGDFRCGLIHEGRIKSQGQFSLEIDGLVRMEDEVIVINPGELLDEIRSWLAEYIVDVRANEEEYETLHERLRRDFEEEGRQLSYNK